MIIRLVIFSLIVLLLVSLAYFLCWLVGWGVMNIFHTRHNYGHWIGGLVIVAALYIIIYGCTAGFSKLNVRRITLHFDELPAEFDGYKIVHFSDAHLGTYGMSGQKLIARNVDSINAQHPDLILFTGDIQNLAPSEIRPHLGILGRLHAVDGIFSCLGNHDYPIYVRDATPQQRAANLRETIDLQRQMGWTVLLNGNSRVCRAAGNDSTAADSAPHRSIVIAGMENDGDGKRFPMLGHLGKTLHGVSPHDFVIMLQHDPTHWRDKILKHKNVWLTLSGHTHASQFMLGGWSPVQYFYEDWAGVTDIDGHIINVSTGLGGFVPFRFGVPGEICVITLKSNKKNI